MRFIRRYRAAVAIAGASVLVLAIVAIVLVQQIRNERDRADDQARLARAEKDVAEREREKAIDEVARARARQRAPRGDV